MDELRGINEDGINKLSLEIFTHVERITSVLNKIDNLVNDTSEYYVCEKANEFRRKFNELRENFVVMQQNILTYSDELIRAKTRINDFSVDLSNQIRQNINNI